MRVDEDLSMGSVCTATRTFKTNCGYSFCIVSAVIDACVWTCWVFVCYNGRQLCSFDLFRLLWESESELSDKENDEEDTLTLVVADIHSCDYGPQSV